MTMNNQTKTKTSKCLRALLKGKTLNRKTLGNMKLAINNDSLHSIISNLRNKRFVPIENIKKPDGTSDYFMLPGEIKNYQNNELRKTQRSEMQLAVECDRQRKIVSEIFNFLERLIKFPTLWALWDELPFKLDDIGKLINALLGNEKKR